MKFVRNVQIHQNLNRDNIRNWKKEKTTSLIGLRYYLDVSSAWNKHPQFYDVSLNTPAFLCIPWICKQVTGKTKKRRKRRKDRRANFLVRKLLRYYRDLIQGRRSSLSGIGHLFSSRADKKKKKNIHREYTSRMNTALISWTLENGVLFHAKQSTLLSRRRWRRRCFWLSLRMHAVMSAIRSPAGKVARFNRRLAKRFFKVASMVQRRSIVDM